MPCTAPILLVEAINLCPEPFVVVTLTVGNDRYPLPPSLKTTLYIEVASDLTPKSANV